MENDINYELTDWMYQVEEDERYALYEEEQLDYMHMTHNPVYEYEGSFGEDDDVLDYFCCGVHIDGDEINLED